MFFVIHDRNTFFMVIKEPFNFTVILEMNKNTKYDVQNVT